MSGVYVLKTSDGYRVAYSRLIEDIYGYFDDETIGYRPCGSAIARKFGNATVFADAESAREYARELSVNYDYLDDGITFIEDYSDSTFVDLVETN